MLLNVFSRPLTANRLQTVAGSCWIIGFVFLILRLYQKLRVQRLRFGWSDGFICVAVILEFINRGAVGSVVTSLRRTPKQDTPEYMVLARRFLMVSGADVVHFCVRKADCSRCNGSRPLLPLSSSI
jgi:hypothetical protein